MGMRKRWSGHRLGHVADEPLAVSLLRYRADRDREPCDGDGANLVSSHLPDGRHAPVIDLDVPHSYAPSSTPGHAHLYLDVPMPRWRMWALLAGLRASGVIEPGFFWWSLRRGGTFVRPEGVRKGG